MGVLNQIEFYPSTSRLGSGRSKKNMWARKAGSVPIIWYYYLSTIPASEYANIPDMDVVGLGSLLLISDSFFE